MGFSLSHFIFFPNSFPCIHCSGIVGFFAVLMMSILCLLCNRPSARKEAMDVYVIDVEGVSYTERNGKFVS